jgi:hypothetical protein
MRLTRRQLNKIIKESLFDTSALKSIDREIGNSSFEKAQADAKANRKAYFVTKDKEVIVFDEKGNADKPYGLTSKQALENNDGKIHYVGAL